MLLLVILLISVPRITYSQNDFDSKLMTQFHAITSEEMMTRVEKLCSPEFNGRLTGTSEYIASAEWVAGKPKEWNIKPADDNGTYFHWFSFPYTVVNDIGSLTLNMSETDGSVIRKNYTYPIEYYPGMNSGNGYKTMSVGTTGRYKKLK